MCSGDKESSGIPYTLEFVFIDFEVHKKYFDRYYDKLHFGEHVSFYNVDSKSYFLMFSVYLLSLGF